MGAQRVAPDPDEIALARDRVADLVDLEVSDAAPIGILVARHQAGHEGPARVDDAREHAPVDQLLPISQLTLVSSLALIVAFSVFLPSFSCQISTS